MSKMKTFLQRNIYWVFCPLSVNLFLYFFQTQTMGKGSKRKLKWRSLKIDLPNGTVASNCTQHPEEERADKHAFVKITSKNLDALIKKDEKNDGSDTRFRSQYSVK